MAWQTKINARPGNAMQQQWQPATKPRNVREHMQRSNVQRGRVGAKGSGVVRKRPEIKRRSKQRWRQAKP